MLVTPYPLPGNLSIVGTENVFTSSSEDIPVP